MSQAFLACLAFTLKHEGGYVDHPADPGGATNMGVTRATLAKWRRKPVSKADVKALTRDEAANVYRRFFWEPCGGPFLPIGVDAVVFDWAVHSGPARVVRALQKVLGLKADGIAGPSLSRALETVDRIATIRALCNERRKFLARLKGFAVFSRGWSRRVDALEKMALAAARSAARSATQTNSSPSKGE
jgi:lysozyme family protein